MNLHVQLNLPRQDGSVDILDSIFGRKLKKRELIWDGFQFQPAVI